MKLTVMTSSELLLTVDVDQNESVENLQALLEVETNVPIQKQHLLFNGKAMRNTDRLNFLGIKDGDLIIMEEGYGSDERNNNSDNHNDDEIAMLEADPVYIESQKKIEARIRQKGIDENLKSALEHNPEAFAQVVMLYVDMEVNGVPVKAFVDSGAQTTIISRSCAERCGLLRLLDERYKGVVSGVGKANILGRIHVAPIKIGNVYYHSSFTVLESLTMEFLFGLDMLRKHRCVIDLMENVLRVGGGEVSVPFLQEKDIPKLVFTDEQRGSGSEGTAKTNVSASVPTQGQSSGVAKTNVSASVPTQGQSSGVAKTNVSASVPTQGQSSGVAKTNVSASVPTQRQSSGVAKTNVSASVPTQGQSSGVVKGGPTPPQGAMASDLFESKIKNLLALGFQRDAVTQVLKLCDGNEEQAASYLFSF